MSDCLCSVIVLCGIMMMKGGQKGKPVPAHSLFFSKSTKGAARLNVHSRRTVGDLHNLAGQKSPRCFLLKITNHKYYISVIIHIMYLKY